MGGGRVGVGEVGKWYVADTHLQTCMYQTELVDVKESSQFVPELDVEGDQKHPHCKLYIAPQ